LHPFTVKKDPTDKSTPMQKKRSMFNSKANNTDSGGNFKAGTTKSKRNSTSYEAG
jgi:hypothetical protein